MVYITFPKVKMTTTTSLPTDVVIIHGWPRWTRETIVRSHPVCRDLGIERVVSDASLLDVAGTEYRCIEREPTDGVHFDDDERNQAVGKLQWCLGQVPAETQMIILRNGYDKDGTSHVSEDVCLSRMTRGVPRSPPCLLEERDKEERGKGIVDREEEEEDGTQTADREGDAESDETKNDDTCVSPPESSLLPAGIDEDEPRTTEHMMTCAMRNLIDCVVEDVDTKVQRRAFRSWRSEIRRCAPIPTTQEKEEEPMWLKEAHDAFPSSSRSPPIMETYIEEPDKTRLLTLVGVLPPSLLLALARAGIPTSQGETVSVTRPPSSGTVVHIGRYVVDTSSWDASRQSYTCTGRTSSGMGPVRTFRNIRDIHRQRIAEFNRR